MPFDDVAVSYICLDVSMWLLLTTVPAVTECVHGLNPSTLCSALDRAIETYLVLGGILILASR